jgi:hypothetical protein
MCPGASVVVRYLPIDRSSSLIETTSGKTTVTSVATPIPPTIAKRRSPTVGNNCKLFIDFIMQRMCLLANNVLYLRATK